MELQISMVKYFQNFCDLHDCHKNFYLEIFMTAAQSTGLDTSNKPLIKKSRQDYKNLRPLKFGAIQ